MREVTASGQTVEEAVQSALKQLSMSRDEVEIEVIDEGKKGFLGLFGATLAIVKVIEKGEELPVVEETVMAKEDQETTNGPVLNMEETESFLREVAGNMGVPVKIDAFIEGNHVTFHLSGEKIAILIGKRGKTLNALQYLTQLVLNKNGSNFHSVTVDAEGYRQRREETLMELAQKMAGKAVRIDGKVALEPMPAYERKIIHSALQDSPDVTTYSDGVEPHRYIVIKPNK